MKVSARRIAANRANAIHSTGPTSPEGKQKASRNSFRHGILARTVVLKGESRSRFVGLLDELRKELEPQTGIECALVDTMAVARWRQMRLWGMEKAGIAYEIDKQETEIESKETATKDAPTRAALAFRALSDHSRSLELMNRYETRYDRQYGRALERLMHLREKSNFAKRTQ